MNILYYSIGSLITTLVVYLIMSLIYKDVEKRDKGFVLGYHKLSYRRRFISTLWGIPIVFIDYLAIYWLGVFTTNEYKIIGVIVLSLLLVEISYNYIKWRNNENLINYCEVT